MRDKGVVQLEETFAPILFYGNTDLCSTDLTDLTEPASPVPITYSPNMVQQQRTVRFLLDNVHVFALKDGISLYAPLYETMEQVRREFICLTIRLLGFIAILFRLILLLSQLYFSRKSIPSHGYLF